MSAVPQTKLTPEEYLEGERLAETKHEYFDGEVYAMAGATREHVVIVGNVLGELRSRLRGKRCEAYSTDLRLQVAETGLFTYPDVMVICDGPRFIDGRRDTVQNPKVIVEVLSPSTEANDRGWKWAHYRQLESLMEYILVAQDRCQVEQYVRQRDGSWLFRDYRDPEGSLQLPSLGCEVPLSEIYYQVEFGQQG